MLSKNPKFGLNGSISTRQECEAAGGTFMPHVFGWMVHMYPWEKTPDEIWSVERQMDKAGQRSTIMAIWWEWITSTELFCNPGKAREPYTFPCFDVPRFSMLVRRPGNKSRDSNLKAL